MNKHIGAVVLAVAVLSPPAAANFGRLLATGGLTTVEGAGGGGIVPWATLSSYAEAGQWGGTVAYNHANVRDYQLDVAAATINYDNRFEFSYARQSFALEALGGELEQTIYGVKYRVLGDVVYGSAPQISMGALHKKNTTFALPNAVGATDDSGTDFYIAATKAWLDGPWHRTWLANVTVRATQANEMGLLGFGGDKKDSYSVVTEAALGMFINRHWIVGVEYRQKPNHLSFAKEQDWHDIFIGWFPSKRVAVALAYANLKTIAGAPDQSGVYGSVQVTF